MGAYFMSICKEIATVAEQWSHIRPEISHIMRAMQDNLKGRVETACGMTDPFEMPGVACGQGHECSPSRSKLVTRFIQEMASKVCRGYRFHNAGIPQIIYADDACFLAEDIAGL